MPETVKMLIVLTVISAAAGFGLAAFSDYTKPAIAENERQYTLSSIKKVIPDAEDPDPCKPAEPEFTNAPDEDAVCIDGTMIYRGRKDGEIVGLAFRTVGDEAYSGTITTLVGLEMDGEVKGVEILKHAETPGLGAIIEDCKWRSQLVGNDPSSMVWKVAKDGGPVDQISGATISSRSVIDGIVDAIELLKNKKQQILSAEPMKDGEVCDGR